MSLDREPLARALLNFGHNGPSEAMAECLAEHAWILEALDPWYQNILRMQVRLELAPARYENLAEEEREVLLEAKHQRVLSHVRREKEERRARSAPELLDAVDDSLLSEAGHEREMAQLQRKKEQLEARREVVEAEHGLEAEHALKPARFALGQRRLESKIAEVEVGVAVAKTAAGQDPVPRPTVNQSPEVIVLTQLIEAKLREITQAEADAKDTTQLRIQLAKFKELLSVL